jgi:hypothetical protein
MPEADLSAGAAALADGGVSSSSMLTSRDGRRASAEGVLDARAGPSGQLYSAQQLGLLVPCQHGITNPTHLVYQPPTLTRVCRVDLARSPEQALGGSGGLMRWLWHWRQLADGEAGALRVVAGCLEDVPAGMQFCRVGIVFVQRGENRGFGCRHLRSSLNRRSVRSPLLGGA